MLLAALAATVLGIGFLLMFIMARRAVRHRYFRKRDLRVQFIRQNWENIVSGRSRVLGWNSRSIDREIVEEILLDRLEVAQADETRSLQELARRSGLLDRRIREVRRSRGWAKRGALLALGRMRAPEGIPALTQALNDSHEEVVIDAIQALGRVGTPRAGEAILNRMAAKPVQCPPQAVQTALLNCYRTAPQELLDKVPSAADTQRPVLLRVLAEVATPALTGDLLMLAADPLIEVRASAARIIAVVRPDYALNALSLLAADDEWVVRLRAVVGIGELLERRAIPILIKSLCDTNRLVRLRAASALAGFRGEEERILQLATQTGDQYALQALVSEIERSGRIPDLVTGLADDTRRRAVESDLLAALQNGSTHILTDLALNQAD
jgi:HEAT repeat protein